MTSTHEDGQPIDSLDCALQGRLSARNAAGLAFIPVVQGSAPDKSHGPCDL